MKAFYQSIAPHAANMITWTQRQRHDASKAKEMYSSYHQKLALIDQLFMFLHKVRVGSLDLDLADKFRVSQSTVSRNIISWANFLYCVLGSQSLWPTRSQVETHMPPMFKSTYPMVQVILDCTELKAQAPSSTTLNSEMFSHYKGTTTFKGLIGITPAGAVSFISSLYTGSISDKHITQVPPSLMIFLQEVIFIFTGILVIMYKLEIDLDCVMVASVTVMIFQA